MDLQLILLLLGLVVISIAAVSAYIKSRGRPRRSTPATDDADGVLRDFGVSTPASAPSSHFTRRAIAVDDSPPVLNDTVEVSALAKEIEELQQSALLPLDFSANETLGARSRPGGSARLDENIDFMMNLPVSSPVARDSVLGVYKQNEYLLERPHNIYGQQVGGKNWTNVDNDPEYAEYQDIALAVQMADVNGPITESDLNVFSQIGLKLADKLGCTVRFSLSFEDAIARGQELDAFCREYDVIASINIVSNNKSGFSGRAIDQAAHRVGMEFGPANIYHLKGSDLIGTHNYFSLANLYKPGEFDINRIADFKTDGLTLFMNVPHAASPGQVFERMTECAKNLGRLLDGSLRDQEQRPLTDQGLSAIRARIEQIATDMRAYGIAPGSSSALRLF